MNEQPSAHVATSKWVELTRANPAHSGWYIERFLAFRNGLHKLMLAQQFDNLLQAVLYALASLIRFSHEVAANEQALH